MCGSFLVCSFAASRAPFSAVLYYLQQREEQWTTAEAAHRQKKYTKKFLIEIIMLEKICEMKLNTHHVS
jgi:hypothetical protein